MEKDSFDKLIIEIMKEIAKTEHLTHPIDGIGEVKSDENDIGNRIGIAVGKLMGEMDIDKELFIDGIKHGISLYDGTH